MFFRFISVQYYTFSARYASFRSLFSKETPFFFVESILPIVNY